MLMIILVLNLQPPSKRICLLFPSNTKTNKVAYSNVLHCKNHNWGDNSSGAFYQDKRTEKLCFTRTIVVPRKWNLLEKEEC